MHNIDFEVQKNIQLMLNKQIVTLKGMDDHEKHYEKCWFYILQGNTTFHDFKWLQKLFIFQKCQIQMFSSKVITYQIFDSKIQLQKIVAYQLFNLGSIQK
jgi:hypothetical protein